MVASSHDCGHNHSFILAELEGLALRHMDFGVISFCLDFILRNECWQPDLDDRSTRTKKKEPPGYLLVLRVFAFTVLLLMLILIVFVDGTNIFYFCTQWTFMLVTLCFALGSLLSIHGCYKYRHKTSEILHSDHENGAHGSSRRERKVEGMNHENQKAGFLCYVFQIIFQRFPWFRIGYFFLWTSVYVIFQWILHACISLWYSTVALMHIPCYGIFMLIMKAKHSLMSKWFPLSY